MYTVIIVDDDWAQRYSLIRCVKTIDPEFGSFLEAKDGQEALHIIETTPIDAVFTDIEMPQMNGIELLNILKETAQDIDVVLVSSHNDFEYARQGIVHGAFDYILKPFDINRIKEVLARLKTAITNKKNKENSSNLLLENLDSLQICEISSSLVELIQNNAQEAKAYAVKVIEALYESFKNDPIKLEYTIKMFISNTLCEAGKMYPWINNFQHFNNEGHANQEYNYSREYVMSRIISAVDNISEMTTKLYLNHSDFTIKQICQYVIQNTDTKISLDEVAKAFNFNSDYLGKLFKSKTGENFSDYIMKIKMERAKHLISLHKYKNYEIAEILGYKDADYFCRIFKKYVGQSPSLYGATKLE